MQTILYNINMKEDGMKFKSDFNRFKRIKKILDERKNNKYLKIDLVSDKSKRLFVCTRLANFSTKKARIDIEEIKGFSETV